MKDLPLFVSCFRQHVINRLEQSRIKITDLVLEELISFALEDSGHEHLYESGSHTAGRDILIEDSNASVKSSKKSKDNITISSFRLSRFGNDLNKMLNFIDNEGKNFDFYYVLAREENKKRVKYSFYILPSNIFTASSMKWKPTQSGWETIENENIKLKIVKNMSSQLWITLDNNFIEKYLQFETEKNISSLGEKRFRVKFDDYFRKI